MARPQHLTKAPIIEALIDLRVQRPVGTTVAELKSLHEKFKGEYPAVTERRRWEGRFEVKDGAPQPPVSADLGVSGFLFRSNDGKHVAQFQLDGFTFSRLAPYIDWEHFRNEARRLWDIFVSLPSRPHVTRVSARFVNVLDFPLPVGAPEEYLTGLPPAPAENLFLESFFNRIDVRDVSREFRAVVMQGRQPPRNPAVMSVLADVEVSKDASFGEDYEGAWKTIDQFRSFKNDLFFNLITDKAVELFK